MSEENTTKILFNRLTALGFQPFCIEDGKVSLDFYPIDIEVAERLAQTMEDLHQTSADIDRMLLRELAGLGPREGTIIYRPQ